MRVYWSVLMTWLCILQGSFGAGKNPAAAASDLQEAQPGTETLTNLAACLDCVRSFPNRKALVQVEASVTLVDRERSLIVLQDDSAAMAIQTPLSGLALKPGQRVAVEGSGVVPYARAFPAYPEQPSERGVLTSFEAPSGRGIYYLNRFRGYLLPPVSGEYTFWISADDAAEFWISADSSPERMQKTLVVGIGTPTGPREWDRYLSQRSKPLMLEAGRSYYVEALHVQSYGRDCFAVAWQGPGIQRSVIEGSYLTPWVETFTSGARPAGISSPTNGLLLECWTNFFVRQYDALRVQSPLESIVRISSLRLTAAGDGRLPAPQRIDPNTRLEAVPNLHWVELEGEVDFAAGTGGQLQLDLKRGDSALGVRILNGAGLPIERLWHSRVRIRGVLENAYGPKGELTGSVVWVPDDQHVVLLRGQGSQPEWLSRIPICEIEPSNPEMRWGRWVSVRGRVITQATNGMAVLQGGDNYTGLCSVDGTNWTSLGRAVEIQASNSVLAGLAVVSRHDTVPSTASFSYLKGLGTNWVGVEIGDPAQAGTFRAGDGVLSVTGSGRKLGERSDQLYYLCQPWQDAPEICAHLADVSYVNSLTQVGLMVRQSPDSRSPFVAVLFTPARGPAFQYRRNLGDAVVGYESKPDYGRFRWLKLVRRKSCLLVQGEPSPGIGPDREVDVTGVITWRNDSPILTEACFDPARRSDRTRRPVAIDEPQSIAGFVAKARHPPEPYLLGRMNSPSLRGIVTYCGDCLGENLMFVQSGEEGGIRVGWSGATIRPGFEVGQLVEVQGLAAVRTFPVILQPSDIKQAGWGTLPRPAQYVSALVKSASGQARWVEAVGVVRSGRTNGVLNLMTSEGVLAVWVGQRSGATAKGFIDALVRMRGVLSLDPNQNALLLVPSPEFVEVEEQASTDPFAIPRFSIARLSALDLKPERLRKMKLGGVVTCCLPQGIYVQDETGGAFVQTSEARLLRLGHRVEAVGFPEKDATALILTEATVRTVGAGELPEPVRISIDQPDAQKFASTLVSLEATLLEQRDTPEAQRLTLRAGTKVFEAARMTDGAGRLPQMPIGSRVALTGVCQVELGVTHFGPSGSEADRSAVSFRIWLPAPANVVLLERPPWWTLKRVAWLGGMFAVGLLGALIWVRMLRQQVARRTRELQSAMRQLDKETSTAAVLAERDRLAGEIHDSLEQGLSAIMLQLDAANRQADLSPEARKFISMARNMAEFSRAEVQHAVWDLQSPLLAKADLGTALKHVASQISSGAPEVSVEIVGSSRPLPSSQEHHLLRIAQEAITNAVKHAQARNIQVTLDYSGPGFKLSIADDGVGFVPGAIRAGEQREHFGLHGIRARARKIDAQLDVASQIGKGTVITVQMSLNQEHTGIAKVPESL